MWEIGHVQNGRLEERLWKEERWTSRVKGYFRIDDQFFVGILSHIKH